MRIDRDYIFELRKKGLSYNDISRRTGVAKSTLSSWFSKKSFSQHIRHQLTDEAIEKGRHNLIKLNAVRGNQLQEKYRKARRQADVLYKKYCRHTLFLAGMMLYWGEGDRKTRHLVRIANSDPKLLRVFVRFLMEVCEIPTDKVRAHLIAYPDHDVKLLVETWSRRLKLSKGSFIKTTVIQGRSKRGHSVLGVGTVYVASTYFKVIIMRWLSLYARELIE